MYGCVMERVLCHAEPVEAWVIGVRLRTETLA